MSLLVRALGPDDWQVLRDVRLAALLDSPAAFHSTYAESVGRDEAEWRAWPRSGVAFCAWLGGEPVGMVGIVASSDGSEADSDLIAMWVAPPARGAGVADALIDAVLSWAQERGHAGVGLEVARGNDRAERVYARHGFVPSGEPPWQEGGLRMRRPSGSPGHFRVVTSDVGPAPSRSERG